MLGSAQSTYLVPSLVSDKDYERAMVLLHIVVNEDGDPRVELLAHLRVILYAGQPSNAAE